MNYWIDLFTGATWDEFRKAGATVSGFSARMRGVASKVKPGDILLCYLTGVMRWVGALQVVGPSQDRTPIWKDSEFPVRFEVRALIMLDAEFGVPMQELEGKVEFFRGRQDSGKFRGFVRMSPNRFRKPEDGELILSLLREAQAKPLSRPVDLKKLARKPFFRVLRQKGKAAKSAIVSVPESDQAPATVVPVEDQEPVTYSAHTEMQYYLASLGAEMGLDIWIAANDRSKVWNGTPLGSMVRVIHELPTQFNEATNRTIELIDVLWLKGNSIIAAFEVESTTSIYSGLLRMSDLLSLQPNLEISLYLVAPDDRRAKVEQEILRPTFRLRDKPVSEVCGFISFSKLKETVDGIRKLGVASSLRADFLKKAAEFFTLGEED